MELKIFLIGYMASGKSFLGRMIAPEINFSFIDLDDLITETAGISISEIFEKKGELDFRRLESKALSGLFENKGKKLIISTGGGTPCFNDNMELIKRLGISIYLDCPAKIIVHRLITSKRIRPIVSKLKENELYDFVEGHLKERSAFYNMADYSLKISERKEDNLKALKLLIESLINPVSLESLDEVE